MKQDNIAYAAGIVPAPRQLRWMNTGYCGFIYYGMNTFTNAEWGNGFEEPEQFAPQAVDVRQWVKLCKLSGMKGLVLTCKHYEGFCLWQTETTNHSLRYSPWKDGKGDLVKECADICKEYGLEFGIYYPLWDRHEQSFGKGAAYDAFMKAQLTELLTNYGDIFCLWLDDTCGTQKDMVWHNCDLQGIYSLVRSLQPNAVICGCGPDVRHVGNDRGVCRSAEWSVVPYWHSLCALQQAKGNKSVTKPPRKIIPTAVDLGGRKAIKGCNSLIWYPAAVPLTLRKRCFFHEDEEYALKPLSKIVDTYYASVGANASFLVGLAPSPEGKIAEKDVETMLSVGAQLEIDFNEDLAAESTVTDTAHADNNHTGQMALSENEGKYWHSGPNPEGAQLILDLGDTYDIDKVVLAEHTETGQQIEAFSVYIQLEGKWKKVSEGSVIGHKRICRFKEARVQYIKVVIEKARNFATLSRFEAY